MIIGTNALSAWAEGLTAVKVAFQSADRLVVPSVVLGEYFFGIRQSIHRNRYESWLRQYLPLVEIVAVTPETANVYADVRLALKQRGTPIPANDAWIAALARQHALPVLSRDTHFDAVDGLRRITF